jgi:hypothetical protein
MKVSTNARSERNATIMRQRQLGKDTSTIAAEFGVTWARICQIVKRDVAGIGIECDDGAPRHRYRDAKGSLNAFATGKAVLSSITSG